MSAWIKVIPVDELKPDALYFLAKSWAHIAPDRKPSLFWSQGLNKKLQWSVKPGIALRFKGSDMVNIIASNVGTVAVEVPADADRRWKARRKLFW